MLRLLRRPPLVRGRVLPTRTQRPYFLTQQFPPRDFQIKEWPPKSYKFLFKGVFYTTAAYLWLGLVLSPLKELKDEGLDVVEVETNEENVPIFIPLWFPIVREGKPISVDDPELKASRKFLRDEALRQRLSDEFVQRAVQYATTHLPIHEVTGVPFHLHPIKTTWSLPQASRQECVQFGLEKDEDGWKVVHRPIPPEEATRLMRLHNCYGTARALYFAGKAYAQMQWILMGMRWRRFRSRTDGDPQGPLEVVSIHPNEDGNIMAMKVKNDPASVSASKPERSLFAGLVNDSSREIRPMLPDPWLGKLFLFYLKKERKKIFVPHRGSVPASSKIIFEGPYGTLTVVARGLYDPVSRCWCDVSYESEKRSPPFKKKFGVL
ncbi:hypothetical protein VTO42DRAFT_6582 [Malbranchea cinnamomea]